jgi:hypothetical protein
LGLRRPCSSARTRRARSSSQANSAYALWKQNVEASVTIGVLLDGMASTYASTGRCDMSPSLSHLLFNIAHSRKFDGWRRRQDRPATSAHGLKCWTAIPSTNSMQRHKHTFGDVPRLYGSDRGFFNEENVMSHKQEGRQEWSASHIGALPRRPNAKPLTQSP